MMKINWSGFSKKTYPERLETLRDSDLLSHELQDNLEKNETLSVAIVFFKRNDIKGRRACVVAVSLINATHLVHC